MFFYDKYVELCRYKGVSPSRAATEAGISKSAVSKWKSFPEMVPATDTLRQLANYFGVSVSELISGEKRTSIEADDEMMELLDMLRMRPECRILLSTARGATREQVEANIRVIDAMRGYGYVD